MIVTPEDGQAILSCDYWTPDTEFPGAFVSRDPALYLRLSLDRKRCFNRD